MDDYPSPTLVGASLQAANKDLLRVEFEVPEGLVAGLGYAITRPGHGPKAKQSQQNQKPTPKPETNTQPTQNKLAEFHAVL